MSKGQMFLIASIVTIIVLVLIKTSLNVYQILENKRYLEAGLERLEFQNTKEELLKTIEYSIYQNENITRNAENFLKYARNHFKTRTIDLNGLLVEMTYPNVSGSTRMDVITLNLLGTEIQNLNLTFSYDNSVQNFTSIADGRSIETNFTFNTATNINYTLSAYYKTSYENRTENISIPVEIGKSKFVGFFDLRLISSRLEQRDKFSQTYNLA